MAISSVKYAQRWILLLSAFAMLAGGGIYLLMRSGDYVFHGWINSTGLDWSTFREQISLFNGRPFQGWIVYSLPNGLWAFAYAVIITGIWARSKSLLKYFWMATIPILVLGSELLQWAGIVRGTFSILDLVLGSTGLVLGIIIGLKLINKERHEKSAE